MQKTLRKLKYLHPRGNSQRKIVNFPRKMKKVYARSIDTIKDHPYQTTGVILGLGAVASALLWLGFRR